VHRKRSRGTELATCDGGMNHHLGATGHLGMVIHRPYRMFKVTPSADATIRPIDLYGPLCTTIDVLGRGLPLPELQVGDAIGIHCSGAYGVTASPAHFISHDLPVEVIVEGRQEPELVIEISTRRHHGDPHT
jgi:diaminopimelate decarboxylase